MAVIVSLKLIREAVEPGMNIKINVHHGLGELKIAMDQDGDDPNVSRRG